MNMCTRTATSSVGDWVVADVCDGAHPDTTERCVLGVHKGYHRAGDGTEWLDDE
jgi:hypothetical protein